MKLSFGIVALVLVLSLSTPVFSDLWVGVKKGNWIVITAVFVTVCATYNGGLVMEKEISSISIRIATMPFVEPLKIYPPMIFKD
jgi:hypothetical protein